MKKTLALVLVFCMALSLPGAFAMASTLTDTDDVETELSIYIPPNRNDDSRFTVTIPDSVSMRYPNNSYSMDISIDVDDFNQFKNGRRVTVHLLDAEGYGEWSEGEDIGRGYFMRRGENDEEDAHIFYSLTAVGDDHGREEHDLWPERWGWEDVHPDHVFDNYNGFVGEVIKVDTSDGRKGDETDENNGVHKTNQVKLSLDLTGDRVYPGTYQDKLTFSVDYDWLTDKEDLEKNWNCAYVTIEKSPEGFEGWIDKDENRYWKAWDHKVGDEVYSDGWYFPRNPQGGLRTEGAIKEGSPADWDAGMRPNIQKATDEYFDNGWIRQDRAGDIFGVEDLSYFE